MNAQGSAGIEPCFCSYCSVINNRTQKIYTTCLMGRKEVQFQFSVVISEGIVAFCGQILT